MFPTCRVIANDANRPPSPHGKNSLLIPFSVIFSRNEHLKTQMQTKLTLNDQIDQTKLPLLQNMFEHLIMILTGQIFSNFPVFLWRASLMWVAVPWTNTLTTTSLSNAMLRHVDTKLSQSLVTP